MENKIKIIFENDDFLVIDKSAGITVNKSDTTSDESTVQDLVEDRIGKEGEEEFLNRGGIVHRLDKETSGILLVAKNSHSFNALQSQFKERTVKKEYTALAHGEVRPEKGEISSPVGRLPWNRKRFGVLAGGREAKTLYEVVYSKKSREGETLSLLRLFPLTGRTHQIRVHLKYINHPIFGDPLYGGRKVSRKDRKILDRVFLHASKITFNDPTTGESLSFECDLPKELEDVLKTLF
jgi:23S rRNA pseudouridine1911/1915/1917 synthase